MRAALTSLLFVALAFAANAQFSITPKVGLEPSRTTVQYNNLDLSPLGSYLSPQIALRLDYKFKKTHGPYLGIATNRSLVAFQFNDPETGMTNYTASAGDRQVRIETGYTYSFKPINFNKSSASKKSEAKQSAKAGEGSHGRSSKSGCHKAESRSNCGGKAKSAPAVAKNKGWNMRIQPSAGMAFNPGTKSDIVMDQNGMNYQYNAGNWSTAFIAGTDFEFGKGRERMFTVGFQYLKGIGNLNTNTITTQTGSKSTTTHLSSTSSSWNVTIGVPFTLGKKQSSHKKDVRVREVKKEKKECIYYRPCRKA